jgi:hypothetical protein
MLPIQASLTGGSSSAKNDFAQGDQTSSGGSGSRGATFNVATGGSNLAASTGGGGGLGGLSPTTIAVAAGGVFLFWYLRKTGKI